MTRLTNAMRKQIADHLINATFRAREEAMETREHALALTVLRRELGPNGLKTMSELPSDWLPRATSISFAGTPPRRQSSWLQTTNQNAWLKFAETTQMPAYIAQCRMELSAASHAEVAAFCEDERALRKERGDLTTMVKGTLAGFTTVEKLAEEWPEGYAHFSHPELAPTTLPAVRIADLNARLTAAKEAA